MRKLGLAGLAVPKRISRDAIVLNPFADRTLLPSDSASALNGGVIVIDCSWVNADRVFVRKFNGKHRKLPILIAGNPTNYAKILFLSSVEAAAASLYIMNFLRASTRLLSIYKWGQTFISLNQEALDEYSKSATEEQVRKVEMTYYPQAFRHVRS